MTHKPSLVFDLDGTLLDVKMRYWTVYKTIIGRLGGKPLTSDVYWRKKRHYTPIDRILSFSFATPTIPKKSFLSQFIDMIEQPQFLALDTPFPYTTRILEQLRVSFQLHIVTVRSNKQALMHQIATLKLAPYFDTVLTKTAGNDHAQTKIWLITSNNIQPAAIIGDTQADIGAAHGLSVPSIAVCSGMRTKTFLASLHPTCIVPDIRSVPHVLNTMKQRPHVAVCYVEK
jgi:phosphoglycolate phosphatase-like HAD superfamily hydrolase